jgi:hypothetical protein
MPEAAFGRATRWLTCLTIDPVAFGADREQIRLALAEQHMKLVLCGSLCTYSLYLLIVNVLAVQLQKIYLHAVFACLLDLI